MSTNDTIQCGMTYLGERMTYLGDRIWIGLSAAGVEWVCYRQDRTDDQFRAAAREMRRALRQSDARCM